MDARYVIDSADKFLDLIFDEVYAAHQDDVELRAAIYRRIAQDLISFADDITHTYEKDGFE